MATMISDDERTVSGDTTNRCDKCGAQAVVEVVLASGNNLMFCSHDYSIVEKQLENVAVLTNDDRKFLA